MMSKPLSFLRTTLARLVVLAVIGAIGYGGYLVFGPTARASKEPLTKAHDLKALCSYQRTYFPDAATYAGPAPHLIQIFEKSDAQVSDPGFAPPPLTQALEPKQQGSHEGPARRLRGQPRHGTADR